MFSFNFTWSWCFFLCYEIVKEKGLDKVIKDFAKSGKPMQICLGMQLLFEESHEFGKWKGPIFCLVKL